MYISAILLTFYSANARHVDLLLLFLFYVSLSLVAESWDLLDLNGNSSSYSCWTNSLKVKSCKVDQSTSSSQSEEGSVFCYIASYYSSAYQIFWLCLAESIKKFKVASCIFCDSFLEYQVKLYKKWKSEKGSPPKSFHCWSCTIIVLHCIFT